MQNIFFRYSNSKNDNDKLLTLLFVVRRCEKNSFQVKGQAINQIRVQNMDGESSQSKVKREKEQFEESSELNSL